MNKSQVNINQLLWPVNAPNIQNCLKTFTSYILKMISVQVLVDSRISVGNNLKC